MTGFGEASSTVEGVHYCVEARALNNKFLKVIVRLPEDLAGLEPEIDAEVRRRITRGSVTVALRLSDNTATAAYDINVQALQAYIDKLNLLPHKDGRPVEVDVASLIALPGVLQPPADLEDRLEHLRKVVRGLTGQACERLIAMRVREGEMLRADLHKHRESIQSRLDLIRRRSPEIVEEYQARLRQRIESMLRDVQYAHDELNVIREVAVFAERADISEEISRLGAHLTQFGELIDATGDEPVGRTLDFLAQELLREANTIASKCNDAQVSREIVEVKGAIDRIKEQVQNVE